VSIWDFARWALGQVASCRFNRVGWYCSYGQAHLPFCNYSKIFQLSNRFKFANYEKGTSRVPKISKLAMGVDTFKWDKFPFSPTSKSIWILNYKLQEQIQLESYFNFKGIHTFEEKFHKFTKILS
jgi:hypothetical protein